MFPDAAAGLPDAGVLAGEDVLVDDDELHAVSATPSTATQMTARILVCLMPSPLPG
jgi:hypothetical protein